MEILGVGPMEFLLVIVLALIILGPKDMAKAGRTLGRFLRKIAMSQEWQALRTFTKEMTDMPTKLMRDAQFDDISKDLNAQLKEPLEEINKTMQSAGAELTQTARQTGTDLGKGGAVAGVAAKGRDYDFSAWTNPSAAGSPGNPPDASQDEIFSRTIASPPPPVVGDNQAPASEPSGPPEANQTILPPRKPARPGPVLLTAEPDEEEPV